MDVIYNLARLAGARGIIDLKTNQPLFAVVTPRTSSLWNELETLYSAHLFADLQSAINAMPDGSTYASYTTQNPSTIYVAPGTYTSTVKIVVPDVQSGLKIYFDQGAEITTATALTAGDGLLEIEGRHVQLLGYPTLSTTQATQTGSALIIGGSTATEGDGHGAWIENLSVKGSTTANDWAKCVVVRGASNVTIKNATILGSTATTAGISVEAGNSRNSIKLNLINDTVKILNGTATTSIPLTVATLQDLGTISGGSYTVDAAAKACSLTAKDWEVKDGAFFGSNSAITSGGVFDLITETKIRLGEAYCKDLDDATTAPTIITQANI